MISFLTQLKLDEISSVDKAANPDARILLMKRAGVAVSPEDALRESVCSAFDDDDLVDKAGFIEAQLKDFRALVGKRIVTIRKGATMSDETIIAIAKNVVERGAPPVFAKADFIAAIARRADEIKKAGESTQQAWRRAITQDSVGQLLYRASKSATGPEVEAAPIEAPEPTKLPPAHAAMQALADDFLRAHPKHTKEGAYAHAYSDPNNHELRERVKAEHFAAISKATT